MKQKTKYIIIIILGFILYGNTLFNDYALDDAIVITDNHYTVNGFGGIKDILTHEFFSGFFGKDDKKLVAGGRYRPLSMISFAIEWQVIMGSPLDGIDKESLGNKMDANTSKQFIAPLQKLQKDLSSTIHIDNRQLREQQQKQILDNAGLLTVKEQSTILTSLRKMYSRRTMLLFISHLVNILLYILTSLILLILLEKLLYNYTNQIWYKSIPFLAALLFLAHPIHTEVVANIKGRDEIMSLLGALLSMLYTFKYISHGKKYYLALSFIFFLFGIFSKEVAVTFLAIVPLSIYYFAKENKKLSNYVATLIPLLLATSIYFYARGKVLGGMSFEPSNELMNNSFLGMQISKKYATIFYTLFLYIKLLIFPHPLTYDYYPYHIAIKTWTNILPVVSLIMHAALGIYALIGLKRKKIISYGILFYLICLSPMSNIFFPIGVFMNERFVYASSIGFILILAHILANKLPLWLKTKNTLVSIFLILMVLYSIKTISRNRAWKDDFTLFTTDVKTSVNSAKSNTSAGGKLIEEAIKPENKDKKQVYLTQSIKYLRKAISIHPTYDDALLLMGNAQWELYQDIDSVFKYYDLILQRNPRYDRVYTNIFESKVNLVFNNANDAQKNSAVLHKLEKYNPNNFYINYNLGRIYGRYLNDLDKSKLYLEKAAKLNPKDINVFKDLGVAYGISKDFDKSAEALQRAVELDPRDPVLRLNLAMSYANLKQFNKAIEIMDTILSMEVEKKDAISLANLANMYQSIGQPDKAQQSLKKAQELNPELFKK